MEFEANLRQSVLEQFRNAYATANQQGCRKMIHNLDSAIREFIADNPSVKDDLSYNAARAFQNLGIRFERAGFTFEALHCYVLMYTYDLRGEFSEDGGWQP
jgi:hypothetical protein